MRILVLNPYHSGSHQSFIEGWIKNSQHDFTLLTLPGRHWKWRMRHAPLSFAQMVEKRLNDGENWDLIFSTDMLNLPEFLGFAPTVIQRIPTVIYFHENQFTYPNQNDEKRDLHFAVSNFLTAVKADQLWFNSNFHLQEFLNALKKFLPKMPDFQNIDQINKIEGKSFIHPPGIEGVSETTREVGNDIHLLWCARWEYDKNPEDFFASLRILKERNVPFRLSVIGESYRKKPECFSIAKKEFEKEIVYWGYQNSKKEYHTVLKEADVIVSSSIHEFFGISVVEAAQAGCFPIVPNRLAYPEVFEKHSDFFYDGTTESLANALVELEKRHRAGELWSKSSLKKRDKLNRFLLPVRSQEMDNTCLNLKSSQQV